VDPDRAVIKAIGESIERYCSAQYDEEALRLATYENLKDQAINPEDFALFSKKQYKTPEFPFTAVTARTPLRWVSGYSFAKDGPIYVPATFVYVPYHLKAPLELPIQDPISTGLACAPNFSSGVYKAICEVIERDAFMIVWQNQLSRPCIDLDQIDDPFITKLLEALEGLPVTCQAFVLTLDIDVPVILVMLQSTTSHIPYTAMGLGTCLNPYKALSLALEEALLTYIGMSRYARANPGYQPKPDYQDVDKPTLHALAHAVRPELKNSTRFLANSNNKILIQNLANNYNENMVANVRLLVQLLEAENLDPIIVDLTTSDVDDAGFKVARAVIPGMQPLDINHSQRHLGGKRLYEVPCKMGLLDYQRSENELNPFPHPFP